MPNAEECGYNWYQGTFRDTSYDYPYSDDEIDAIVQKAMKIAKRSSYLDPKYTDYTLIGKTTFLDCTKFEDQEFFYKEIDERFKWYVNFVNLCLYNDYGDNIDEFRLDHENRYMLIEDEICPKLNNAEKAYFKRQIFYPDLVYYTLCDVRNKIQTRQIDNLEFQEKYIPASIQERKPVWYKLYYPVNLNLTDEYLDYDN